MVGVIIWTIILIAGIVVQAVGRFTANASIASTLGFLNAPDDDSEEERLAYMSGLIVAMVGTALIIAGVIGVVACFAGLIG